MKRKVYFFYPGEKLGLTHEVIAIVFGERGYYPIETKVTAERLNELSGISPRVAESAVSGSMFGWDVPAAEEAVNYARRQVGRAIH